MRNANRLAGGTVTWMELAKPSRDRLPGYLDAVRRGWMGDRPLFGSTEALLALAALDQDRVLDRLSDRETNGELYFPDGSTAPRIPALFCWMWDEDGFAGNIDLRWQPGTDALPDYVPGHLGYGTVGWKQGHGYAMKALSQMLPLAKREGLNFVELVTSDDNHASGAVIEKNAGVLVERFRQVPLLGGGDALRWHILL